METCNGIIHTIDQVMLDIPPPFENTNNDDNEEIDNTISEQSGLSLTDAPSMSMILFVPEPTDTPPQEEEQRQQVDTCSSLVDLACSINVTSTLCDMIREDYPNLATDLTTFTWTVFAPTDKAFDDLALVLEEEQKETVLLDILMYHMVPNFILFLEDLQCTETMVMANEEESRTVCDTDDAGTIHY
jgi:uncharacterized surface protein with fasciclin (FAS1) repeats